MSGPSSTAATEREALLDRHRQFSQSAQQNGNGASDAKAGAAFTPPKGKGRRHGYGVRSTSASSQQESAAEDGDENDLYDDHRSESELSHVLLDTAPTYVRLICSHVMALLPCVALLLASVMLAWHAPCHIRQTLPAEERPEERRTCSRLLSDRVSLAAFGLGVVCWLAAFAVRPGLWKVIEVCLQLALLIDVGTGKITSRFATVAFVLLKTSALELLRLFSVLLANALIFAGLLRVPNLGKESGGVPLPLPDHPVPPPPDHDHVEWILHWYDPRFTVAMWLAVGWAVTEFAVSSWQLFDRLSLYEVDFDEHAKHLHHASHIYEDEEEVDLEEAASGAAGADASLKPPKVEAGHRHQLSDSDPSGDTSDSAATVRARSTIHIPGAPGPEASDGAIMNQFSFGNGRDSKKKAGDKDSGLTSGALSPGARLLHARKRVLAAAEESGISLPQSDVYDDDADNDEAEELGALRQTLDVEMDALVKARTRVELEASFGQPLTSVPIVLCTLWRIDGWLWNLGATLMMAASVTLSQGPLTGKHLPPLFPPVHANATTLIALISLHTLLTVMWTMALPLFGFAFVTYASMLAGLGLCIIASARWGLLI